MRLFVPQVLTPPEQRPAHLPAPIPVPPIPSRNMSTDQFLSLLNQLITSQEPAVSGYPPDLSSPLAVPQESNENLSSAQNQSFRLNRDYSIEPIALHTGTMDDMHTLPYRRDSEEKRLSLSKSFSVPSLLNLSSHPIHNMDTKTRYESADPSLAPIEPPKLVCGPQTAAQLPPGVLHPLAHSLVPPVCSELQQPDPVTDILMLHYTIQSVIFIFVPKGYKRDVSYSLPFSTCPLHTTS